MEENFLYLILHLLLLNPFSFILPAKAATNETDLLSLISFKSLITNDPLEALSSWNNSVHHCRWKGVICGRRHPERVTAIVLNSTQLSGYISPFLGNLTFLQRLDLSDNFLRGSIPHDFGRLSRLRYINFNVNSLISLPSTLANCSRLQVLTLKENNLQGVIPSNLVQCRDLRAIVLMKNSLVGGIPPEFGSFPKLNLLHLSFNNLTGTIPPTLGNLTSLENLYIYENGFTGQIPASLDQLKLLRGLHVGFNKLSGKIPNSLYNLSTMVYLYFTENQLEGFLPSNMCDNFPNLDSLIATDNQLTGQVPASISNCSALTTLTLGYNSFTGIIPISIGSLKNLEILSLTGNQLKAKVPVEWSFIDALSNCTNLEALNLGNNQLGSNIPTSIGNLSTSLYYLGLHMNPLSCSVPAEMAKLTGLISLEIYQARLKGSLPLEIGKLSKLQQLALSENMLSGEIPTTLCNITWMDKLYLGSNALKGSIPVGLSSMRVLELLDLSNNKLIGEIPKDIMNLPSLSVSLDLSNNFLEGSLPAEIGNLKNIKTVILSNNRLSGEIPSTIATCQLLQMFDVSNNFLSGPVPKTIGRMNLQYLNISFNNFEGELPDEGIFKNSSEVDVRGNPKLCGGVPEMHLPNCVLGSSTQTRRHPIPKTLARHLSIASAFILLSTILCFLLVCYCRRKTQTRLQPPRTMEPQYKNVSYNDFLKATDNFCLNNLIGKGTFGTVYKAVMRFENMTTVAVKVLNLEQRGASRSFLSECMALKNIKHRNLIKILSSCSSIDHQGNTFKALIFEFMPNGSLESWLHSNECTNHPFRSLTLMTRINIAIDVAEALNYLHHYGQAEILHCDLKPSNVLLDENMTAHLSDFGLAKVLSQPNTISSESTSTCGIKGSIGYIPPECGMGGQPSAQGDVYSYGILLLEMFTGVSPTDERFGDGQSIRSSVEIAFPDRVMDIIDPKLLLETQDDEAQYLANSINDCLLSVIRCALLCSNDSPKERVAIRYVSNELNLARERLQIHERD